MNPFPCRACKAPRNPRHYLCPDCWAALPGDTRRLLNQRGPHALARLRRLHDQIDRGIPLRVICVMDPTPETQQ